MLAPWRESFNAAWTPEGYRLFLEQLNQRCGTTISFRVCETPCFFPRALLTQLATYGSELVAQLLENPTYLAAASETIPEAYRVPNEAARPLFVQAGEGQKNAPALVLREGLAVVQHAETHLRAIQDCGNIEPGR